MKDSRADAFSTSRHIPIERKVQNFVYRNFSFSLLNLQQQLINRIVSEELAQEINNDIELHESVLKEILEYWDQWEAEESEKEFESVIRNLEQPQVCCPVCLRSLLTLAENIISCNCGLR